MERGFGLPERVLLLIGLLSAARHAAMAQEAGAKSVYPADAEIVRMIEALAPGEAVLLPPVKHFDKKGDAIAAKGREGPYARDYTNKMAYAPDRGTALYCGGNHGAGRTNDVWEFHLASNSWRRLHSADGGDHARFKFALMFYPRMMAKDANAKLSESQQKEVEACAIWWRENVALVEGNFVMKGTGAPLLVGHTWDTLMYDPVNRRLVHGTGAHCANVPWLEHRYNGTPLEEVQAKHGKRADGTPWRRPWFFDPAAGRWRPYAHASALAEMKGMGGSLLYISDSQRAVWYYSGQNSPGAPHVMALWDLKNDTWEEMKPNDGIGVGKLGIRLKIAPEAEQQMVYVPGRKEIVAVLEKTTYAYEFATNKWSKRNDGVPFEAHNAKTVFACDEKTGICLLADPKQNRLAAYDPAANQRKEIKPGVGMPKPPYGTGKGYFDQAFGVMVVQSAYTDRMWVYRHGR